ncbi:MAG: hypothetical protein ISR82_02730 [Candidatus Marinimicrobia bacterium]|nr:hypothetical protein [Candidatus Neomarinimicrobiota bacterium]MBL7010117.1 hypothetical protein [Candidatus Neomarinimicrobiota bacterium]MBL7029972.1 hypothetical protein [Candidatus Neomarinimicrobiota bacterium]
MKSLFSALIIISFGASQDVPSSPDLSNGSENAVLDTAALQIPSGLDTGYKGFAWGSQRGTDIPTTLTKKESTDSLAVFQTFIGSLGPDSVSVSYFYADSGFWKVEIDVVISLDNIDGQIADFRRLEKNISEVYGPPKRMNQQESGPSGTYANLLDQKYSRAFYRSTWSVTPAVIELFLNSSVLLPATDLQIFSGKLSILKLVYYNPDFMHSSQPVPELKEVPSIFEIY